MKLLKFCVYRLFSHQQSAPQLPNLHVMLVMTELISARKQDWNFLFWQALIWNKTKENSNFSTCYIFSYILPSSILTQQHSTVLVI